MRSPRLFARLLAASLLVLSLQLTACGEEAAPAAAEPGPPSGPPALAFEPAKPGGLAPDPAAPGPFPVGVRTVEYLDFDRPKPDGSPRRLVTEIWYPAVEEARGQPGASYDIRDLMTEDQRTQVADLDAGILTTTAVRDAAPRLDHGRYPLVIFGHGQGGMRWQSTYYTVVLASHGYVVASPDHEGGTLGDLLRDELEPTATGLFHRSDDASFLIGKLSRVAKEDFLSGMIDATRVGATGHSFGAIMSLRAAAFDPRIKVIVPQAPASADIAWLGLQPPVLLGIPVMIQAGHLDRTLAWDTNVATSWALLQAPRVLVDFTTGGHFTFSDLCAFDLAEVADRLDIDGGFPGVDIQQVLEDGCGPPAPPASVAQPMINHFALAFFNATLRENEASWALIDQASADAFGSGIGEITVDRAAP